MRYQSRTEAIFKREGRGWIVRKADELRAEHSQRDRPLQHYEDYSAFIERGRVLHRDGVCEWRRPSRTFQQKIRLQRAPGCVYYSAIIDGTELFAL